MIKILFWLIIIVLILSLLGVNIASLFNNRTIIENFSFLWHWTMRIWQSYLAVPLSQIWHFIWTTIIQPGVQKINAQN